ncbi:RluA family pseudouridine synthase [Tepidibacter formicigenes]|uniref:RNA pseudouridylate synthase n=1 Tax=Tepidibacter formicigenes DSM 15518 TaxID=1123349 RepID=A0A1M6THZ0_9FIRM|nr:RNA pseudouridine synthase [Tepidibacter formicigenes]SHK56577.1 23S rRNA pseudouridine1911/1915/1917 synthase [Tepidibacter formicigenes DSM 15518]
MVNIIYEDNHLLVVKKPVNVLSQGDNTKDRDMLSILKQYIKEKYNKPGNVYLGLVHRLDRPVGGCMVFAKTSKSASRLSEQVRNRSFKKTYLAVLRGTPNKKEGILKDYLYKDSKTNTVKVVDKNFNGAKEAVLEYKVLESKNNLSLVRIELKTGRPHQIRVQFSSRGNPLYGDQKYGKRLNKVGQQIALWSYKIGMNHPTLKEVMNFTCLPPDEYPWNIFDIKKS